MRIDCLTLFPEMFESPLSHSILKRAQDAGIVNIHLTNIRDFSKDPHRKVDDRPYGGGPGMVMAPQPLVDCWQHTCSAAPNSGRTIILTPQGRKFDQTAALELSREERIILISGRYEGFDERILEIIDGEQISIGDFVLSGGELASMVVIDAVVRLLKGSLGDADSVKEESFSDGLLEYPHYTRPEEYRSMKVPEVLLNGNHAEIAAWRKKKSLERTKRQRPDLLD